jgi:hypothetical protein
LAYEKAGEDLLSAAWLRAYLAVEPNASNATAVRDQIIRSEVAAESKIPKIIQAASDMMKELNWDHNHAVIFSSAPEIERAWAAAGDVDKSKSSVEEYRLFQWHHDEKGAASLAWGLYAHELAMAGDADGAKAALTHVSDPGDRKLAETCVDSPKAQSHAWEPRKKDWVFFAREMDFRLGDITEKPAELHIEYEPQKFARLAATMARYLRILRNMEKGLWRTGSCGDLYH